MLCLGARTLGFVIRLPAGVPAAGRLGHELDLEAPPTPEGRILVASTWNFQAWFRDFTPGGSGFNFSDALSVTFCPCSSSTAASILRDR